MTGADIKWLREEDDPIEELTEERRKELVKYLDDIVERWNQEFERMVIEIIEKDNK